MAATPQLLTARTSVEFNYDDTGQLHTAYVPIKLVLEMDDRKHDEQVTKGTMRIRVYPATAYKDPYNFVEYLSNGQKVTHSASLAGLPAQGLSGNVYISPFEHCGYSFRVTQGRLTATQEVRVRYVEGTLVMSGGREFDLPYPIALEPPPTLGYHPTLSDSIRLTRIGAYYDGAGNNITDSVVMQFDSDRQKIVTNTNVYGEVYYRFRTEYLICAYEPASYGDHGAYYIPNESDYGSIVAYPPTTAQDGIKNGTVVFQVQMPPAIGAEFELYRVESSAIVNDKGVWEKPKAWPTDGLYGDIPDKILDTAGAFLEVARVHEVATVSMVNTQKYNETNGSITVQPLPVSFTKEEAKARKYIGTQATTPDTYLRNVKNFPNTTMRTTKYAVPIAQPYDAYPPKDYDETLWLKAQVTLADGSVTKQELKSTVWTKYKIKLKVTAGRPPNPMQSSLQKTDKIDPATGMPDVSYDFQAAYVNAIFRRMWDAVDWDTIKKHIQNRYDPDVYQIEFDSTFPTSNG